MHPRVLAHKVHRTFKVAILNFLGNNDLLWASALTYTVTLSIVPILALAFSALKALGGIERIRPLIDKYVALGSPEVGAYLMHFISNVNPGTLGSVGGAALLLTVISTLGTIERAFNTIWEVPAGRSHIRKFTDYLSIVFTVPLLLVAALSLTATFTSTVHLPGVVQVVPFLLLWVGFFFLFLFFPYTNVRLDAAAAGSFISALFFQVAQWAYVYFQVGVAKYQAIYGTLATIPVLLVWIYVGWIIVLFGVEVSFAAQKGNPPGTKSGQLSSLCPIRGLAYPAAVGRTFLGGKTNGHGAESGH
jgi:membrane protein